MLMQEFDRLLFLAKGGKTVYFGEMGENSSTLTSYFERNGSHPCPPDANPAEWMLEVSNDLNHIAMVWNLIVHPGYWCCSRIGS